MRTFFAFASLLALSSSIACSATPDDGVGKSEANATEGPRALGIVKGRELARCWFERVADDQQLSCTSTAKGTDPLSLDVRVGVSGSNGFLKQLDVTAGGTVVVGSLPASSFPRDVSLQAYMNWDDRNMIGSDDGEWSAQRPQVDASTITKDQPLIISEPFDFWELGTIFAITQGGGYGFTAHEYKRDMSPYVVGLEGKKELTFTPDIAGDPGKPNFIVAPKDAGPLAITWDHDGKKIETSIAGPGYYAFTDDGIRVATPEEVAKNYGAAPEPQPQPQPGGQPEPTPQPTPEPTPTWVDPDTTCGGNGQHRCAADKSCDPGTRFDFNNSCMSCGVAGETYCLVDPKGSDSSLGKMCNAGTRFDFNNSCIACGEAGQTYCLADPNGVNSSLGKKCNAGTRFDFNNSCITCGEAGQTYCLADPNGADSSLGRKCNAGTRFDFNNSCITCGGEGQTYCLADPNGVDSSKGKTCNDGLKVSGNGTCTK